MDKRFKKVEEDINIAYWKLIKKHRIKDITVKQICEEANIGRNTFYSHYENYSFFVKTKMDELIDPAIAVFFEENSKKIYNPWNKENYQKVCMGYIKYIYDNKDIFYIYFNNDEDISFCELFMNKLDQATFYYLDEKYFSDENLSKKIDTIRFFCRFCNTSNVYTMKYCLLQNQTMDVEIIMDIYKNLNSILADYISKKIITMT